MNKRLFTQIAVGGVLLLGVGITVIAATFVRVMVEQILWFPRDETRLQVIAKEYAEAGIALTVRAPAGIASVWKQDINFVPLLRQHRRVPFKITPVGDEWRVLVDYPFDPYSEWSLAVHSKDGHWTSMSPYFPERPDISKDEWIDLQANARLGGCCR